MNKEQRLNKQIAFLMEIDKVKNIFRRTYLTGGERHENDAEHSWHLALYAMLLSEYSEGHGLDISRVIRLVLVHDLVEIYAGDTFIYDEEGRKTQEKREAESAERLFSLLPGDQKEEFLRLIEEFNGKSTREARFAGALDRLQPLLHNYYTRGKSWKEHGIRREQVMEINGPIRESSPELWTFAVKLIDDAWEKGWLK